MDCWRGQASTRPFLQKQRSRLSWDGKAAALMRDRPPCPRRSRILPRKRLPVRALRGVSEAAMFCNAPALAHTLHLSQAHSLSVRLVCPRDASLVEGYVRGRSPGVRYRRSCGAFQVVAPTEFERVTSQPCVAGRANISIVRQACDQRVECHRNW